MLELHAATINYDPMWPSLKIARPYRIETPIPADAFFEHLPKIPESRTPWLSVAMSFAQTFPRSLRRRKHPRKNCISTPQTRSISTGVSTRTARSFTFGQSPRILDQLIQFSEKIDSELLLSDHISAYSAKQPLFIYHGTFREPIFLSTRIPREKVAAFADSVCASFEGIDFDKEYP